MEEWQYAAKCGGVYIYAGGDIDEVGWYMIVLNRDL